MSFSTLPTRRTDVLVEFHGHVAEVSKLKITGYRLLRRSRIFVG